MCAFTREICQRLSSTGEQNILSRYLMETVFAFNFTNETCILRSLFAVEVTVTQAIPFDICIRPRNAFSIRFCNRNVYRVIFLFRIFSLTLKVPSNAKRYRRILRSNATCRKPFYIDKMGFRNEIRIVLSCF